MGIGLGSARPVGDASLGASWAAWDLWRPLFCPVDQPSEIERPSLPITGHHHPLYDMVCGLQVSCVTHVLDALSARPTGCFARSPVQHVEDKGEILEVTSTFIFATHDG